MAILDALIVGQPLVMDPIWRPWAVGNGRLRIQGTVGQTRTADRVQYRLTVNGVPGNWTTVATGLTSLQKFSAWVGEGFFEQGSIFTLEVRARETSTSPDGLAMTETFEWLWPVRDVVGRFLNVYMTPWLRDSELGTDLYTVMAKMWADVYAAFDDVTLQCVPTCVTWAAQIWEEQLGIPVMNGLSWQARRDNIVARRSAHFETRTDFMNLVFTLFGNRSIVESYATYTDTLLESTALSATQRRVAESLLSSVKPVGVNLVYITGGFLAGVNAAGDVV